MDSSLRLNDAFMVIVTKLLVRGGVIRQGALPKYNSNPGNEKTPGSDEPPKPFDQNDRI
jgi:hypothetical protein